MRATFSTLLASFGLPNAVEAAPTNYNTTLSALHTYPTVSSPGTGTGTVTYDPALHLLRVGVTFENLIGRTSAAHLHCGPGWEDGGSAPVAIVLPNFPALGTSGSYDSGWLDLTSSGSWSSSWAGPQRPWRKRSLQMHFRDR